MRPILNMSSPKGSSFNDAVDPHHLKQLRMSSARLVAKVIRWSGKGAQLAKLDLRNTYKYVTGSPAEWKYFGFRWLGKNFFDITTVFGSKSAPANFDSLPEILVNMALSRAQVPSFMVYGQLDDVPIVAPAGSRYAVDFESEYRRTCRRIQIPLAADWQAE